MEGRPWVEWKGGKPITVNALARLLKGFHIFPSQIWLGGVQLRGYELGHFDDAFARYLQGWPFQPSHRH
jgi:hypothetical protein